MTHPTDQAPADDAWTGPRPEDGPQDVDQEPRLVEEDVADGDHTLADPAVHQVA